MRFFFELVSCIGPTAGKTRTEGQTTPPPPYSEEARSQLVIRTARKHHQQRRRRRSASSSEEWKPSLGVILEDKVGAMIEKAVSENKAVKPERVVVKSKRKTGSHVDRVHSPTYNEDYGQRPASVVIPAFSPTPFFF